MLRMLNPWLNLSSIFPNFSEIVAVISCLDERKKWKERGSNPHQSIRSRLFYRLNYPPKISGDSATSILKSVLLRFFRISVNTSPDFYELS